MTTQPPMYLTITNMSDVSSPSTSLASNYSFRRPRLPSRQATTPPNSNSELSLESLGPAPQWDNYVIPASPGSFGWEEDNMAWGIPTTKPSKSKDKGKQKSSSDASTPSPSLPAPPAPPQPKKRRSFWRR